MNGGFLENALEVRGGGWTRFSVGPCVGALAADAGGNRRWTLPGRTAHPGRGYRAGWGTLLARNRDPLSRRARRRLWEYSIMP